MPYKDKLGRLCGFLNVEEKEGSGKYVRRYFVLDKAEQKLQYYIDNPMNLPDESKYPCSIINIAHISKVSEAKKQKNKSDSCFVVNHAGKTLHLQAESQADMQGWIQDLFDASKITVPSDQEKRLSDQDISYKTEIAGGVVCKIPIKDTNDQSSNSSSESEDSYSCLPTASEVEGWKSGFCVKQGGIRKNWKRRFFVVSDTGLQYFSSNQSKEPIRTIPKNEIVNVQQSQSSHTARDNLFEVVTSKRTFYIQCDSPQEVEEWITAIKRLLDSSTKPPLQRKLSRMSSSKKEEEMDFPVMQVYPHGNWSMDPTPGQSTNTVRGAAPSRSKTMAAVRKFEQSRFNTGTGVRIPEFGASKSLSVRSPPKEENGSDQPKEIPQRLKKQRSWFLW